MLCAGSTLVDAPDNKQPSPRLQNPTGSINSGSLIRGKFHYTASYLPLGVPNDRVTVRQRASKISGAVAGDFELAARGVSHFHFLSFVLFLLSLLYFSLVFSLSKTQKN